MTTVQPGQSAVDVAREKFAQINTGAGYKTNPKDIVIINNRAIPKQYTYSPGDNRIIDVSNDLIKGKSTITTTTTVYETKPKEIVQSQRPTERQIFDQILRQQQLKTSTPRDLKPEEKAFYEENAQKQNITPIQQTYLKSIDYYGQKAKGYEQKIDFYIGKYKNITTDPLKKSGYADTIVGKTGLKLYDVSYDFIGGVGKAANPYTIPMIYQEANLFFVSPTEDKKAGIKGAPKVLKSQAEYVISEPFETAGVLAGSYAIGSLISKGKGYAFEKTGLSEGSSTTEIELLQSKKFKLEEQRKQLIINDKPIAKINKDISDIDKQIITKQNILEQYNIKKERELTQQPIKSYIDFKFSQIKSKIEDLRTKKQNTGNTYYESEYNIPLLKKTEFGELIKVGETDKPVTLYSKETGQPIGEFKQLIPKEIDVYEGIIKNKIQEKSFKKSQSELQTTLFKTEKIEVYSPTETGQKVKTAEYSEYKPTFVSLTGIPLPEFKFKSYFDESTNIKLDNKITTSLDEPVFNYKYTTTNPTKLTKTGSILSISNIGANKSYTGTSALNIQNYSKKSFIDITTITVSKTKSIFDLPRDIKFKSAQIQKVGELQIQTAKQDMRQLQAFKYEQINQQKIKYPTKQIIKYDYSREEPKFFAKLPKLTLQTSKKSTFPNLRSLDRKLTLKSKKQDVYALPDLYSANITELRTGKEATAPKLTKKVFKQSYSAYTGMSLGFVPTEEIRRGKIKI